MALKVINKLKIKGVTFNSGKLYSFIYTNWESDPKPLIIFINQVKGIHPGSGNTWNLIQGINLHYMPWTFRQNFVNTWYKNYVPNKPFIITWNRIKHMFPRMKPFIRRYIIMPSSYIQKPQTVAFNSDSYNEFIKGKLLKPKKRK